MEANREIKFRAWDKRYLRMVAMNAWHFDTGIIDVSTEGELRGFRDDRDFEVMQYTGLKDKNGKEVYEGDIVRVYNGSEKWINTKAEWREFAWYLVRHDGDRWYMNQWANDDVGIEVIGNIYENPELLEDKN